MTNALQSDDPIIQGFNSYLKSRRFLYEYRRQHCTIMKYKVLPKYSLKEIRETDEFKLAAAINQTGNRNTEHQYRHVIRKFKEYLMRPEA